MGERISAVVLAAGDSSRMGKRNKLVLPFDGKTIIETVIDNLLAAEVNEVIVVLGFEGQQIRNILKNRDVHFVENPNYEIGMTSSIQTGVSATSERSTGYLICLSDMPFLTPQDYNKIISARKLAKKCIIKPNFQGQSGNPILFSAHFRKEILNHKPVDGCRQIVIDNQPLVVKVAFDNPRILRDIDTKEDYSNLTL